MCIRDRKKRAFEDFKNEKVFDLEAVYKNLLRKKELLGYEAVSYTHLRAHETVLDIVCRLLLEKTNQLLVQCYLRIPTLHNINQTNNYCETTPST